LVTWALAVFTTFMTPFEQVITIGVGGPESQ
jgi:hypothetical protein